MHLGQAKAGASAIPFPHVVAHREGGANRTLGVVLVGGWNPEDGHEPVALDLGYRPAEGLDDLAKLAHRRTEERVDVLRVERLGERRIPGQVGEQHRDELALAGCPATRGRTHRWGQVSERRAVVMSAIAVAVRLTPCNARNAATRSSTSSTVSPPRSTSSSQSSAVMTAAPS